MNTFQLECFLAVAEFLSFARAAEQMKVSQPAISHQIQSLEGELNTKLFRRTTRTVELTVAGLAFLDDAKDIVVRTQRAIKRFEHTDAQEMPSLSIGCTSLSQLELLPGILRTLKESRPNLHPRLFVNPSIQLLTRVEEGAVDVALGPKNIAPKKSALTYREVRKVPLMCLSRSDHPLAEKRSVTLEEVRQHPLILYMPGSATPEVIQIQHQLATLKRPSELYFCESAETALTLVRAGFGVTVLPSIPLEDRRNLALRPLADADEISFGCYYKTLKGNPLLRDFVELLKRQKEEAPTTA